MQLSEMQWNIILGIVIVGLLVLNVYLRKLQTDRAPIGRAVGILGDIRKSLKQIETFTPTLPVRRLPAGRWHRNKKKLDFMPEQLRNDLATAFASVDEANGRIDEARRNKSESYLVGLNLEGVKNILNKVRLELTSWLQENLHNKDLYPRRKSLFDMFRWGRK